ncbi:addiction module protein [candidate division KSB1 bacterium]|nr:addiction module protein [candidate division KSB1 bacterium]
MHSAQTILEEALKMKPTDRFLILDGLLKSLDEPDKSIDEIWAEEAESRLKAYRNGILKTYSYDEVFGNSKDPQ